MTKDLIEMCDVFKYLCDDIKVGNFIMSNNKIMQLLRYIASHQELREFVSRCNEIEDYTIEYNEATNSTLANIFKLPKNKIKIVTLVTGLLYEFDRGTVDIISFLKNFYPAENINDSFNLFCDYVIAPYADAFVSALDEKIEKVEVIDDIETNNLTDSMKEQINPFLLSVTERVLVDRSISENKRKEFLSILEGMYYLIEIGNTTLLKPMWIGLKNTFGNTRNYNSEIAGMESILKVFSIL